jgi:CheY-like chemotaxis protein
VSDPPAAGLVLIVEDDASIAEGLGLNLRLQGYRTDWAADGEAAEIRIAEGHPDLVLLDISLPKRTGIEVLEELRAADNHVPVIVLSARQDEFDKVAALQLGADDYVTKPFGRRPAAPGPPRRATAGREHRRRTGVRRGRAPLRRRRRRPRRPHRDPRRRAREAHSPRARAAGVLHPQSPPRVLAR